MLKSVCACMMKNRILLPSQGAYHLPKIHRHHKGKNSNFILEKPDK